MMAMTPIGTELFALSCGTNGLASADKLIGGASDDNSSTSLGYYTL